MQSSIQGTYRKWYAKYIHRVVYREHMQSGIQIKYINYTEWCSYPVSSTTEGNECSHLCRQSAAPLF